MKITFETVRRVGLTLPDVEEGTSYGSPALMVHGAMFACVPSNKSAEPGSLVVRMDFEQRDELLAADPKTYYVKEHYLGYPCVVVRLARLHADALKDLLLTGRRFVMATTKPRSAARKRKAVKRKTPVRLKPGTT
jgi:hypothetical protein